MIRLPIRFASALAVLAVAALGCQAQAPTTDSLSDSQTVTGGLRAPSPYQEGTPSRDGTGRFYMGREIAQVMGHRGAAWLERPERERTELPDRVVENLDLQPSDVVADIGAGTGYFTFRIAPLVPDGRVMAVDIQPEMLAILERRMEEEGVPNVAPVWGAVDDPRLQDGTVDVTLIVDAYHEFSYPREMVQSIFDATRPGGRLVLVEYRGEDDSVPIKPLHKMTEEQVRREIEAVGFEFVENRDFLPQQHFLVFQRVE